MAQLTKLIKRRIRSVKNTKQITKAMELVAAAKMRHSIAAASASRTYASKAWELLTNLAQMVDPQQHDLLTIRPIKKICIIFFSSNRGLAGAFNTNLNKKLEKFISSSQILTHHDRTSEKIPKGVEKISDLKIDYITVGKKGAQYLRRNGRKIIAAFDTISDVPSMDKVTPIMEIAVEEYRKGNYDRVVLVYSNFESIMLQEAKIRQLLPISAFDLEKTILSAGGQKISDAKPKELKPTDLKLFLFEPSADQVLDSLLMNLVKVQIYQVALETAASKYSARMIAMSNATESADEMIKELEQSYNQSRQTAITQEIAEISSGVESLA